MSDEKTAERNAKIKKLTNKIERVSRALEKLRSEKGNLQEIKVEKLVAGGTKKWRGQYHDQKYLAELQDAAKNYQQVARGIDEAIDDLQAKTTELSQEMLRVYQT
ncbi:hypothetical protein QYI97_05570 [Lacticaseibacillus paracasei]|uniref:DUF5082 family protein n=1 Tax=Lacticaseibacillus paracasei TaxID=1597 RepID=UPI00234A62F7|nr:DUF5082 family protein [Lacticaseibacillus paracasei]MDC6273544.1 hypothetical protein [Lacticaseibacillus paracasei]MDN4553686.1 hypothetical protein [Lacticaseibacillus paracasei]